MNPEWVQVRLRRETHAALRTLGKRMLKLVHEGRKHDLPVDSDQFGIDVIVRVLLARDEQHQKRNRRRKRGKKKGRPDGLPCSAESGEEGGGQ